MSSRNTFNRAKQIIEARRSDPDTAARTEHSVATQLVGPDTLSHDSNVRPLTYPQHGYLSPMAATEAFAEQLQRGLKQLASNLDLKSPPSGKYNPLIATPTLSREVWRARQVVDELSIPYAFYVDYAVLHWYESGNKRMPRPSQLTSPEIAMHVMQLWADPGYRVHYPLFVDWDDGFYAAAYPPGRAKDRALQLVVQRVDDFKALGLDPAAGLAGHLGNGITEDDAVARFGPEVVSRARDISAARDAQVTALTALAPAAAIEHVIRNI